MNLHRDPLRQLRVVSRLLLAGAFAAAGLFAASLSAQTTAAGSASVIQFTPPPESAIPNSPLGDMISFGRDVFNDTQRYAKAWVGNGLNCRNCHLDSGRAANSAPLWAAYVAYPAFMGKNKEVDTFAARLEMCFRYSMNGKAPPPDSAVIVGLTSYAFWLATGAPVGAQLAGRGYPAVSAPPLPASVQRGATVYAARCEACHGVNGAGVKSGANYTFPPLWGRASYNAGAGMHGVQTAASFIKAKMPLGQGETLTDQDAFDVAAYINSKPRPPRPPSK